MLSYFEDEWCFDKPRPVSSALRAGLLVFPFIFIGFVYRKGYSTAIRALSTAWLIVFLSLTWLDFDLFINTVKVNLVLVLIFECFRVLPAVEDLWKYGCVFDDDDIELDFIIGIIVCPFLFIPSTIQTDVPRPKFWKTCLIVWGLGTISIMMEWEEAYAMYLLLFSFVSIFILTYKIYRSFKVNKNDTLILSKAISANTCSYQGTSEESLESFTSSLQTKFDSFWQVLNSQFSKKEQTYARYKNVVQELNESAYIQLKRIFVLKHSISNIDQNSIVEQLNNRELNPIFRTSLEEQLNNYQRAVEKIKNETKIIEQIKTKISVLTVSLGSIDTHGSETTETFSQAIEDTQELIDRIERYDVRNT